MGPGLERSDLTSYSCDEKDLKTSPSPFWREGVVLSPISSRVSSLSYSSFSLRAPLTRP